MKRGPVDMYIKFNKDNISKLLPEKRPGMIFSNPDLFVIFNDNLVLLLNSDRRHAWSIVA